MEFGFFSHEQILEEPHTQVNRAFRFVIRKRMDYKSTSPAAKAGDDVQFLIETVTYE